MYKLPENLKDIRSRKKLTQTQIAEKLGMTYQEYQKIEAGKTVIRADKLFHICETLDVSADELLGLRGIDKELEVVAVEGLPKAAKIKGKSDLVKNGRIVAAEVVEKIED